jgi:hypothetical protein
MGHDERGVTARAGNPADALCGGAEGFGPLTPCMPLMLGEFMSPCTTSTTHAIEQVKGAAEGWVVWWR